MASRNKACAGRPVWVQDKIRAVKRCWKAHERTRAAYAAAVRVSRASGASKVAHKP